LNVKQQLYGVKEELFSMSEGLKNMGVGQKLTVCKWDRIVPNPWNPNAMDDRQFDAELESIMHHGFIDPITVRENSSEFYEIVDGEHRLKALKELKRRWESGEIHEATDSYYDPIGGWKNNDGSFLNETQFISPLLDLLRSEEVSVINLGKISDTQAKKLTITLNETRGRADVIAKSELLGNIMEEAGMSLKELQMGLPYIEKELNELVDMGKFDWDSFSSEHSDGGSVEPSLDSSSTHSQSLESKDPQALTIDSQNVRPEESSSAQRVIICPHCGGHIDE
jgi:hypothetical protein